MPDSLATSLAGIPLKNPIILAAGTCGVLDEMAGVLDLSRVGAIVTKSITRLPREGNATWRILDDRHHGGMLNAIGLANPGIETFVREIAPRAANVPTTVIGSIAGFSIDDYVAVASAMNDVDSFPAVELNVSCPNVHGGVEFGLDPAALRELVGEVRRVLTRTCMFVKLSPIVAGNPGIVAVARAAIEGVGRQGGPHQRPGCDGLVVANTVPGMGIDVGTRKPRLSNVTGGFSGPAIHPITLKLVHDVYRGVARDTKTPIVGLGGVLRWDDAAEFVLAGASAVAVGTALFVDPRSPLAIARGLDAWVRRQGCSGVGELVGRVDV